MRTLMMTLAVLLIAVGAGNAQPKALPGSPPTFRIISRIDKAKGVIVVRERAYKPIPVQKEAYTFVWGRKIVRIVTETVLVAEEKLTELKVINYFIMSPAGKDVPIDDVWGQLKVNGAIVFSVDSRLPDQAYLSALNPDALIFILPRVSTLEPLPPPLPPIPLPPTPMNN